MSQFANSWKQYTADDDGGHEGAFDLADDRQWARNIDR